MQSWVNPNSVVFPLYSSTYVVEKDTNKLLFQVDNSTIVLTINASCIPFRSLRLNILIGANHLIKWIWSCYLENKY